MAKDLTKIRDSLHKLKLKTVSDFIEGRTDGTVDNIQQILDEYNVIAKQAQDLVKLPGKDIQGALTTQSGEYHFFRRCQSNLKGMVDYFDSYLKHTRGKVYKELRSKESRDHNDRAINSLIDANATVNDVTVQLILVRDMYDRFTGIVESYNQRGYSLNNITKILEIEAMETIL